MLRFSLVTAAALICLLYVLLGIASHAAERRRLCRERKEFLHDTSLARFTFLTEIITESHQIVDHGWLMPAVYAYLDEMWIFQHFGVFAFIATAVLLVSIIQVKSYFTERFMADRLAAPYEMLFRQLQHSPQAQHTRIKHEESKEQKAIEHHAPAEGF